MRSTIPRRKIMPASAVRRTRMATQLTSLAMVMRGDWLLGGCLGAGLLREPEDLPERGAVRGALGRHE